MKLFFWTGDPTNLGRFGQVYRGDPLVLMDSEIEQIRGDKRFRPGKAGETFPEFRPTPEAKLETKEQAAARLEADQARQSRWESLKREADPARIEALELREKTWDELVQICADLGLTVTVRASEQQLITSIMNARRQQANKSEPEPEHVSA